MSALAQAPCQLTNSHRRRSRSAVRWPRNRTKYGYDAAGNALTYGTVTLAYNDRGRAKTVKNGSVTETLIYSALGQMIKTSGGAGGTVLYVYDEAGHLLGEYSSTGTLVQETVWLGDIPVATIRPSGSSVAIYYVHTDLLNTPHLVTRPIDNVQMWRWFPPTFGNSLPNTNPGGAGTFNYDMRYPGQIYDGQAGLHQNVNRDYDPLVGKYVESDPLGIKPGVNTYAYVRNNPESYNDPTGLQAASTWGCDGMGHYVPFIVDKNPCTAPCTRAHEEQHIADYTAKWGSGACLNKPPGYIPTAPENRPAGYGWPYHHYTECRAYKAEVACLKNVEGKCQCKQAAHARLYSAEEGVELNCHGGE